MNDLILWPGIIFLLLASATLVARAGLRRRRRADATARATLLATQAAGFPSYRVLRQQLPAEFARVRRYGRQLMILVVKLQPNGNGHTSLLARNGNGNGHGNGNGNGHGNGNGNGHGNGNGNGKKDSELVRILLNASFVSYVLRDGLRGSDLAGYDADLDRFVIALPEIEREQAERFTQRQTQRTQELLGVNLHVGMAGFPGDGLALEELVAMAHQQCLGQASASAAAVPAAPARHIIIQREPM